MCRLFLYIFGIIGLSKNQLKITGQFCRNNESCAMWYMQFGKWLTAFQAFLTFLIRTVSSEVIAIEESDSDSTDREEEEEEEC